MEKIKIFESVINSNVINEIEDANWCTDLAQYATCKCKIDELIAAAYLFCPQLIQVKDYIFIEQFWNCNKEASFEIISELEEQYHNDNILIQFANAIVYFWKSVLDNDNAMYCEIRYTRDKSSFAGFAFEITDECGITCSDIKEK